MGLLRTIGDVSEGIDELPNVRCDNVILHLNMLACYPMYFTPRNRPTYLFTETKPSQPYNIIR